MATYEEMRDKGFIDVDVLSMDREDAHRFCMENRLILRNICSLEEVYFSKEKTPLVINDISDLGNGNEAMFILFKIGSKRDIILINGEIPELIRYLSDRDRKYQREYLTHTKDIKGYDGGYIGGYVPYGYYRKDKRLYIDDYESFIVKFVFYRRSAGCSFGGIAKELNLRGFRNRNKNPFKACSIKKIIDNKRLYQGYVTYKGKEVKAEFRGILEDSEEMLTKEWKERVFDEATEARISKHRERFHSEMSVPKEIRPYILPGIEPKKKVRRDV